MVLPLLKKDGKTRGRKRRVDEGKKEKGCEKGCEERK
jgi:hypothetical protein